MGVSRTTAIGLKGDGRICWSLWDVENNHNYIINYYTLNNNTWYHLVAVYNKTDMIMYINGVDLDVKNTATFNIKHIDYSWRIGRDHWGPSSYHFKGIIDEIGIWNRSLSKAEVNFLYNEGVGIAYNCFTPPIVILNSPENNYLQENLNSIIFNTTVTDNKKVQNVTLYIDGILNDTDSSMVNGTYIFTKNVDEGFHNWSILAYDNSSAPTQSPTRNFTIKINPVISNTFNLTNLITTNLAINSTWSFNASDTQIDKCYYNTTDHALQIITCNSTIKTNWSTQGEKGITYCANDTFGFATCNTEYIRVYFLNITQTDNPDPIGMGATATFSFTLNSTLDSIDLPISTATLIINNTIYSPTTTTSSPNGYEFTKSLIIPKGWGNTTGLMHDWYWNYSIAGITEQNTSITNITIYEMAIDNCAIYTQEILNLSLKDEETNSIINTATHNSTIEVDIKISSIVDPNIFYEYSYTFINESNPRLCVPFNLLNNTEYRGYIIVGLESTDHVWEFWYLDDGIINLAGNFNDYTNKNVNLMNLLTTDSTSFLFNYFNLDGQAVEGSIVHVFRKYIGEGLFREVERSKADERGDTIVHLVEEDVIYYFMISLYGKILYTTSSYTALCQAVPCSINIEEGGESAEFNTDYDLIDGGEYLINESRSSRMVSLVYELDEPATMDFTLYEYESDGTYTTIDTITNTNTEGVLTLHVPLSAGNVSFFASVVKDGVFINSKWIDFSEKSIDHFGNIFAIFLGGLLILTLGLMAISTGAGVLIWVMLGVFISSALGLFVTSLNSGISVIVYLICAGGLLLWKVSGGRK